MCTKQRLVGGGAEEGSPDASGRLSVLDQKSLPAGLVPAPIWQVDGTRPRRRMNAHLTRDELTCVHGERVYVFFASARVRKAHVHTDSGPASPFLLLRDFVHSRQKIFSPYFGTNFTNLLHFKSKLQNSFLHTLALYFTNLFGFESKFESYFRHLFLRILLIFSISN